MPLTPHDTFRPRILVVEDEYIIAAEMVQALEDQGAEVVGPAGNVEHALALIARGERLDGAVLDINLRGELVFPVADVLLARGVPFVFATGYSRSALPPDHRDVVRYDKPVNASVLATALLLQLRQR